MKSALIFFLTISVLASGSPARGQEEMSLDQAVALALKHSPLLLAAEKEADAASGRRLQMQALADPSLVLSNEGLPFSLKGGSGAEKEISLGFEQSLEFPGKRALRGRLGRLGEEMAGLEIERARLLVSAGVKKAYYRAVLSAKSVESIERSVALLDRLIDNLVVKYRTGDAAYADILRARVEKARLLNQALEEKKEGEGAKADLNLRLGRDDAEPLKLTTDIVYAPLERSLEALEAEARIGRPSLKIAALKRRQTETGFDLAAKSRLPDFALGLSFPSLRTNAWGFSLGLSLPIWGKRQKGEIMEAGAARATAVISSGREERRVVAAIRSAFRDAGAAEEQVKVFEQRLLRDMEDELKLSLDQFQFGKIEFFSLLDLYRTYTAARLEHLKAVYLYLISLADLEAAGEDYAIEDHT
jgi:outer membrane protein, heavy metal efflux system